MQQYRLILFHKIKYVKKFIIITILDKWQIIVIIIVPFSIDLLQIKFFWGFKGRSPIKRPLHGFP